MTNLNLFSFYLYVVTMSLFIWDNVITPTLNTPTVITPTLNTPTVITPTRNTPTVILLRQSLPRLLILRQWPIIFAILALLTIQMQYRTVHLTWKKRHGLYPGICFVCSAIVFKAFQRGPTKYFLQNLKRKYYFMYI